MLLNPRITVRRRRSRLAHVLGEGRLALQGIYGLSHDTCWLSTNDQTPHLMTESNSGSNHRYKIPSAHSPWFDENRQCLWEVP
jgi:hypothetical protein